jgi:hypothetical protein
MSQGAPKQEPLGIASLACGLISMPACCCGFFNAPLALAAVVLGIISIGKVNKNPEAYKGKTFAFIGIGAAIAGIVLMVVGLTLNVAATLLQNLQNL